MNTPTAADELAIMRTLARLARAQDDVDREAYLACFTEQVLLRESVVIPDWSAGMISATELADRYFAGVAAATAAQHLVANHLISVDGDDAECGADLLATSVRNGENGDEIVSEVLARYQLHLVRNNSDWLISERSVHERRRLTWSLMPQ